jgi:pimeloyl-ACP methyl ester carboxylesterase
MPETISKVNGIELGHETFGSPDGRPLLMIMGLASQMIWWDDELCETLASEGFYVIRFDNRDAALAGQSVNPLGVPGCLEYHTGDVGRLLRGIRDICVHCGWLQM